MLGLKQVHFDKRKSNPDFSSTTTVFEKPPLEPPHTNDILEPLKTIENILKTIYNDIKQEELLESDELKWKYASIVMDRFFFYVSGSYFLLIIASLIFTMPNFYKPV